MSKKQIKEPTPEFKMMALVASIQLEHEAHEILTREKQILKHLEKERKNLQIDAMNAKKTIKEGIKAKEKKHAFWYGMKNNLIKELFPGFDE